MQWHYFRKRKHRYPVLFPIAYYSSANTKKNFGIKVGPVLVLHDGKEGAQYNIVNFEGFNKVGNFLFQKVIKEPGLLEKQRAKSRKTGKDFIKWCKNFLISQKLSKISSKSLRNLLFQYQRWYEKFALVNISWRVFLDDRVGKRINDILVENKYQQAEIQKVNQYLFSPTARSYALQENIDFLKLLSFIRKQKNQKFLSSFFLFQKEKSIYPKFKKFVKKYFWIPWDYMGPKVWDEKFYFHKIKSGLKQGIIPEKEITRLNQETGTLRRKQARIIKKLKLSKNLLNLISALQTQIIMQDDKKAVTTESHFYLGNLLLEISKRISIPRRELYLLSFEEIGQGLLKHNLKNIEEKLRERHKLCLVITDEGKLKILTGKAVLEYAKSKGVKIREKISSPQEIRGTSACLGKAKGKVRILPNASFIRKFKNDEILVTSMTTPDFISAIKKAVAIITDEGGITCHAAIISRELQIPCIIGTKIATRILKDGDVVEVDANKGIVKIIKKK